MIFLDASGAVIYDGRIVVGQSYRISATLGINITGATSKQFGYRKPGSLTLAYWTAVVDDALTGAMHYDVTPANNDTPGNWTVWYKIVQGTER